jgi:ABC-type lipoprotein release transport system permease subunit
VGDRLGGLVRLRLVSAITMSVIERTCEIGILRCIGARARGSRRVFEAEGVVLALLGWPVGTPLVPVRRAARFEPGDALRYA